MGQATGNFAPSGHTFGLHELLALFAQLSGHVIESSRKLGNLIPAIDGHARFPISLGNTSRTCDKPEHRARNAGGSPPAEENAEANTDTDDTKCEQADSTGQSDRFVLGIPNQEHAEQIALAAQQRKRVKFLSTRGVFGPVD